MTRIATVVLGASLAVLAGRASSEEAAPTDADLRAIANAWRAAYNAGDAAAVAALYEPDGYYVSSHVVAHGRAEIQAYFQRGIDAGGHIDSIALLGTGRSGALAYWIGTYEATNAGRKVRGRNLVVVRNVAGTWLMAAHETAVSDPP